MNHYQKIALIILRSVGLCLIAYSAGLLFFAVAHLVLLENRETGPVPLATNLLYFIMYCLTGALLYLLSGPLAYIIAGRFKGE
jgi:hypothetical protein